MVIVVYMVIDMTMVIMVYMVAMVIYDEHSLSKMATDNDWRWMTMYICIHAIHRSREGVNQALWCFSPQIPSNPK